MSIYASLVNSVYRQIEQYQKDKEENEAFARTFLEQFRNYLGCTDEELFLGNVRDLVDYDYVDEGLGGGIFLGHEGHWSIILKLKLLGRDYPFAVTFYKSPVGVIGRPELTYAVFSPNEKVFISTDPNNLGSRFNDITRWIKGRIENNYLTFQISGLNNGEAPYFCRVYTKAKLTSFCVKLSTTCVGY